MFGVEYVFLRGMQGGWFYFTRHGWRLAASILPRHWYTDGRFRETGTRLVGSTGTVYRVPLPHSGLGSLPVVMKFNRFAQDAPVFFTMGRAQAVAEDENDQRLRGARFLSPFEEFGLLEQVRQSHHAVGGRPILTQRPYGIYAPPMQYPAWRLGRDENRYWSYDRALAIDQSGEPEEHRVRHDWNRAYVTLFQWIGGIDAESAAERNRLGGIALRNFSRTCYGELARHGFAVWDNKPRHLIVPNHNDAQWQGLVRFRGKPLWALVDYELLYRINHPKPIFPALDPKQCAKLA